MKVNTLRLIFLSIKLKHAGNVSSASEDALSREDPWQACQKLLHLPEQAEQPKFSSAYTPEIEFKRPKNGQWGRRQATGSSLFHLWSCFYIIFTGLVLNMYSLILSFTNLEVEQHLAGKNHTRLAAGLPGLKPGYFNKATSKWERAPPEEHQETPTPAPTPSLPSTSLGSKVANEHNFYCQLCKVTCCQFWFCLLKIWKFLKVGAPSQTQMDMHLNGKSHKVVLHRARVMWNINMSKLFHFAS